MHIRQIRQFLAVAETLNFNRAAKNLNISQPPLSLSIRKLETELGSPLFIRDRRRVMLTPAGELALEEARKIVFHAEAMKKAMKLRLAGLKGQIQLGLVGTATTAILPSLLPRFCDLYPDVELIITESWSPDLLERLHRKQIDLAIIRVPVPHSEPVDIEILMTEKLVVAVPLNSRFAQFESIDLRQLKDEQFIGYDRERASGLRSLVMFLCQRSGFVPTFVQQVVQIQAHIALTNCGMGISVVPSAAASASTYPNVKFLKILNPHHETSLALVSRKEDKSPLITNLVKFSLLQRDEGYFGEAGKASAECTSPK